MGQNKDRWRADFDWLIGERGMQKILEGSFQKAPAVAECAIDSLEFQKKYTNAEGLVDAKAILRDIDAAERRKRPIGIIGNHGNTGEAGFGHSRGNPG
jgi:hypothetical protein